MATLISVDRDWFLDLEDLSRVDKVAMVRPITVFDVALALSREGRYSNFTGHRYSVAQHACWVHDRYIESPFYQGPREALGFLGHDNGEAITRDLSSPAKRLVPGYVKWSDHIQNEMYRLLGGIKPDPELLRVFDDAAVAYERTVIWDKPSEIWSEEKANAQFLDRWFNLVGRIGKE